MAFRTLGIGRTASSDRSGNVLHGCGIDPRIPGGQLDVVLDAIERCPALRLSGPYQGYGCRDNAQQDEGSGYHGEGFQGMNARAAGTRQPDSNQNERKRDQHQPPQGSPGGESRKRQLAEPATPTGTPKHRRKERACEKAWYRHRRQRGVKDFEERTPRQAGQENARHSDQQTAECPTRGPGQTHADGTTQAPEPLLQHDLSFYRRPLTLVNEPALLCVTK